MPTALLIINMPSSSKTTSSGSSKTRTGLVSTTRPKKGARTSTNTSTIESSIIRERGSHSSMCNRLSIMKRYAQPLVVFVIIGLSLCEGLGHSRYVSEATQEIASEVYSGKDVAIKAIVEKNSEPSYTRDARKHKIEGTVILKCVFASNGKVTNIHVISGLPDGLTERAVKAAQKIKFKPATRDGKPVSMWMQLEYNFNLR